MRAVLFVFLPAVSACCDFDLIVCDGAVRAKLLSCICIAASACWRVCCLAAESRGLQSSPHARRCKKRKLYTHGIWSYTCHMMTRMPCNVTHVTHVIRWHTFHVLSHMPYNDTHAIWWHTCHIMTHMSYDVTHVIWCHTCHMICKQDIKEYSCWSCTWMWRTKTRDHPFDSHLRKKLFSPVRGDRHRVAQLQNPVISLLALMLSFCRHSRCTTISRQSGADRYIFRRTCRMHR